MKSRLEKEHERRAKELLRLAGVLDNVDDDVVELCISIMPKGKDTLISMAEIMKGIQNIKNKLKRVCADELKKELDWRIESTQNPLYAPDKNKVSKEAYYWYDGYMKALQDIKSKFFPSPLADLTPKEGRAKDLNRVDCGRPVKKIKSDRRSTIPHKDASLVLPKSIKKRVGLRK